MHKWYDCFLFFYSLPKQTRQQNRVFTLFKNGMRGICLIPGNFVFHLTTQSTMCYNWNKWNTYKTKCKNSQLDHMPLPVGEDGLCAPVDGEPGGWGLGGAGGPAAVQAGEGPQLVHEHQPLYRGPGLQHQVNLRLTQHLLGTCRY